MDPASSAPEYEALRSYSLGESPLAFVPLGLAVLRREGIAGWLAHAAAARNLSAAPQLAEDYVRPDGTALGATTRELVRLLAGAALLVMKASPS